MKAAVLKEINSPLSVEDVELTPLQPGQVLVKVLVSGLCGAQLHEIKGHKGNAKFLPHLMGHEGCGIVEEITPGVTTVKPGDKVVMHWRKSEGIEAPFPKYILDGKEMSSGKVTTLSEYSIVSENRITTVPHDTSDFLCALLGCGMSTALGTINNDAKLKFGESILIVGCGGVGLNLIQGAVLASAYPIVALDINESKHSMAKSLGASFFTTQYDNVSDQTFDVIIDTTGNTNVIKQTIGLLADAGRYILVGQPKPGEAITISDGVNLWSPSGKSVSVSQGGCTKPRDDIPRYVKMHKAGILNIDKIITHVFALEAVNEAFDILKSGDAGRIMIKMN
jgi:S-(hydroxymethyl)glutathione dehydrogenase/alcohol dehydrogenase